MVSRYISKDWYLPSSVVQWISQWMYCPWKELAGLQDAYQKASESNGSQSRPVPIDGFPYSRLSPLGHRGGC